MRWLKSLIIIVLLSAFSVARGQNDNRQYDMILEADSILSRCVPSYDMYVAAYQYLISGYSELGANMVVDYLARIPYLEYLEADAEQKNALIKIAESYERVKIGSQAPEIQSVTVYDKRFDLYDIDKKYTLILFWSYSCPHCRNMMNELGELASRHDDIAIVTVNVSGDFKQVKKLIKMSGLKKSYNICDGKGWDSKIVDDYAVDMTPSLFLLDDDKVIIAKPFDLEEVILSIEL